MIPLIPNSVGCLECMYVWVYIICRTDALGILEGRSWVKTEGITRKQLDLDLPQLTLMSASTLPGESYNECWNLNTKQLTELSNDWIVHPDHTKDRIEDVGEEQGRNLYRKAEDQRERNSWGWPSLRGGGRTKTFIHDGSLHSALN